MLDVHPNFLAEICAAVSVAVEASGCVAAGPVVVEASAGLVAIAESFASKSCGAVAVVSFVLGDGPVG